MENLTTVPGLLGLETKKTDCSIKQQFLLLIYITTTFKVINTSKILHNKYP